MARQILSKERESTIAALSKRVPQVFGLVGLILWSFIAEAHHRPQDISIPLASAVDLDDPIGYGSGTVIEILGERLILTAKHVAVLPDKFTMQVRWHRTELVSKDNPYGIASMDVELVALSNAYDLAVLRPVGDLPSKLLPAKLAEAWESPGVGTPVVLISAPITLPSIPTTGTVVLLKVVIKEEEYTIITAPALVGSSGGGVYTYGKLIGVATGLFYYSNTFMNTSLFVKHSAMYLVTMVPLEAIRDFLRQVKKILRNKAQL